MTTLERIAYFQKRRDEVPNQELARDLASRQDIEGICEIAENLWNKNKSVQADCIKVLYEIGYVDPALIADYAEDFIKLLHSRNNRLVWGGMTALSAVAALKPQIVFTHLDEIEKVMDKGSVITMDNGVQALARAASKNEKYGREILPYLLEHLSTCRPKDVAQHAEKSLPAINANNKSRFIAVLTSRMDDLTDSALARVKKVIKQAEAIT
ncbi:MAG: hypothetical protein ACXVCO_05655 [Ktedonobacterales bacterium]